MDKLDIFIIIYLLVFLGVAFVWRTYRVWKQTGINAYKLASKTGPEKITAFYFRLMPWLSILVATVYVGFKTQYALLAPFNWLALAWVQYSGVALMVLSLTWVIIAQSQMGQQWRIGIDHDNQTALVTEGIFALSRNPIFLGVIISAFGYFLLLPNAITLLIVCLDIVLIQVQVAMEEEYLHSLHRDKYAQYCNNVRRWI